MSFFLALSFQLGLKCFFPLAFCSMLFFPALPIAVVFSPWLFLNRPHNVAVRLAAAVGPFLFEPVIIGPWHCRITLLLPGQKQFFVIFIQAGNIVIFP